MDLIELELDDPSRCFQALVARLGDAWQVDGPWRAEAVRNGVTLRLGLTKPPDGPWTLAWTTEAHVPEAWALGAMGVAIALATATMSVVSALQGPGPSALAAAAVVLASTLAVLRRWLMRSVPDVGPALQHLRASIPDAIREVPGVRVLP